MGNEQMGEGSGQVMDTKGGVTPYKPPENPWEFDTDKPMNKWSKDEVKNYFTSLTYTDTTKGVMSNKIQGKDLLLSRTPQQLAEKLGIPEDKAEGLFELLQVQKQREMFGSTAKSITKGGDDMKEECAQEPADYNANFMGSESWKTRAMVNWTPYNMKSWFVSEFRNVVDVEMRKKILNKMDEIVFRGEKMMSLEDGEQLAKILEIDEKIATMIYNTFEQRMSNELENADDEEKWEKKPVYRVRKLPWRKFKFIKLTAKEDCVMGYTNADKIDRAEMKCGHAIAADTMFFYIKSIIEKNIKAVKIICPVPNCKTEWDWDSCLRIADMTNEEMIKYNTIKTNRTSVGKFKSCPHCKAKIVRPETLNQFRVNCGGCNGGDFCYICEKPWISSGKTLCGNADCSYVKGINKVLQKCDMKPVEYLKDQGGEIPRFRSCPGCLAIIEHTDACKHMNCVNKDCKTSFCFICLSVADGYDLEAKWPKSCGERYGYQTLCELAPRQYFK